MSRSDTWWERQLESVDRYMVQHEKRHIPPSTLAVYRLFGYYVRAAVFEMQSEMQRSRPKILDVGCGIFPKLSPAMEGITDHCDYLGVDPLPYNEDRQYPFVCARLEDLAERSEFHYRFDLFVFGTSLDHIEDLGPAADAVRKMATPNALLVCWNGLQDPDLIASDNGALLFRRVVTLPSVIGFLAYFGYGVLRLPRLLLRTRKRRRALNRGQPLDHHFRWFSSDNAREILSVFGEVTDLVTLPNTHHSFATVRIS